MIVVAKVITVQLSQLVCGETPPLGSYRLTEQLLLTLLPHINEVTAKVEAANIVTTETSTNTTKLLQLKLLK